MEHKTPHLTKHEQQRLVCDFFHFIVKLHAAAAVPRRRSASPVRVSGLAKASATVGGESYGTLVRIW